MHKLYYSLPGNPECNRDQCPAQVVWISYDAAYFPLQIVRSGLSISPPRGTRKK